MTKRESMVLANFRAFQKMSAQFKKADKGKYALLRDQKLIGVFDTARLAHKHALDTYDDDNYSVQEVGQKPIDVITFPAMLCLISMSLLRVLHLILKKE